MGLSPSAGPLPWRPGARGKRTWHGPEPGGRPETGFLRARPFLGRGVLDRSAIGRHTIQPRCSAPPRHDRLATSRRLSVGQGLRPGHFVPGASLQFAPRPLLLDASPLLEEEWNLGRLTLVANLGDPLAFHRSGARARLAAHDHPTDAAQVEVGQRAEQGLKRQELRVGMGLRAGGRCGRYSPGSPHLRPSKCGAARVVASPIPAGVSIAWSEVDTGANPLGA